MATFFEIKTPDATEPQGDGPAPGLRRALPLFAGVLSAIAIPYAIVALAGEPPTADTDSLIARIGELRAWVPGDPAPFSTLFTTTDSGVAIAEAGMSRLNAAGVPPEAAGPLAALAEDRDADRDDPELGAPIVMVRPPVTPAATPDAGPSEADAGATATDAGPTVVDDVGPSPADVRPVAAPDPFARIVVPPEAWEGITAEIEDPHGVMGHFYRSLARTALGEEGAITRVTQWGDSAIAADGMTAAARRLLQRQFGDAGHGFGLVASGNPWYRQKDVEWSSSGWKTWEFIRKQAADGRYGYGGVAAVGYQGAAATWATIPDGATGAKASRFEVWYAADKGGGKLQVSVDGEEQAVIDTAAGAPRDEVAVVEVPDGQHRFKIRNIGGGATRVYGAVLERAVPGVVYDAIGIVGARAARQLFADERHFVGQIAKRAPDLMILMYGGNALPDKTNMEVYREAFGQVLERFRKGRPEASCLVMSPLDHGERHRGRVRSVPRIHDLMAAQREVALAKGCAWYSIFDAMGGEGAVGTWYDSGLVASDLAHPTARGSKVLGALWYKSLMKGFAGWLEARQE